MASFQEGPSVEFCVGHKREQSQDSGAYIDWNSEDSASPVSNTDVCPSDDFITVVAVENGSGTRDKENESQKKDDASFVTILAIGEADETSGNHKDVEEEVLVYRLPGERLGFGLKFEGGTNTAENVKRLFIQSSAPDSPASRAKCSWGTLVEGDEILKIDGNVVKNMTRLDCVRCLKESSVVIKLYVRHKKQKRQQLNRIKVGNANDSKINNIPSSSPTVVSAEMKKNLPPPPPPVPPRKITKKYFKENSVNAPESFCDSQDDVQSPMPKIRTIQNSSCEEVTKNASKFIIRVPQKSNENSPEMSKHSFKRNISDSKIAPPEPKVYLDLLAQEETRNGESESDDTCSTVSTVVGLSSAPTTTNSSFSDLRSSASSFCDSTNPSTPNSEPSTPVLELSRILPPFDHLQSNEFLFSKLISDKDQDINYEDKTSDDVVTLQPPLNFQDAPLSYGNEEMRNNITESLSAFQDESFEEFTEVSCDFEYSSPAEDVKLRDKVGKDSKKPSLIPRLAKSIGLLSPPKPSPRKESKSQEGNKSRFHKKKPPPPPLSNGNGSVENGSKILKSSIPYLKKKKNKNDDYKKAGKRENPFKMDIKQEIMSASDAAVSGVEDVLEISKVATETEATESSEAEEKLTWKVPDLKNFIDIHSGTGENYIDNINTEEKENDKMAETNCELRDGGTECLDVNEGCESQFMFLWSGSKQLETIGEVEEDITADESVSELSGEKGEKECQKALPEKAVEEEKMIKATEVTGLIFEGHYSQDEKNKKENFIESSEQMEKSIENQSNVEEKNEEEMPICEGQHQISDEYETTDSKHIPNTICGSHVLVKLDNDSLEAVKKAVVLKDSNGDLKETMVPVVSTAIGLVASTSNCRMPPDGHEFPQKYSEKLVVEPAASVKMTNGLSSDEADAGLPPLPTTEPPSIMPTKYLSPIFTDADSELHAATRKADSAVISKPPRNSCWRQDEKSEKSVRDKIAMFSSVPEPASAGSGNLSKYKSSEDVFYSEEPECNRNIQNGKLFSRSVMTLDKVTGPNNPYAKKHSFGDMSMPPRSLDYSNRTQSSVDLSSASSSAYSSSCSPDSSLSSNSSSYLGYSSTLPRKKTRSEDNKGNKKEGSVHRTTSFSVHGRSQSLLDVNPTSYRSKYLSQSLSEETNSKSGALNLLMEQRRKNLTKLRGLVIPEKLGDSTPSEPIVDLPEIRSRDSILNTKVTNVLNVCREKAMPSKWSKSTLPEAVEPKLTPTHLWGMQNKTPNIPKYSPAFKRKSISVFGAREPLSLNINKDISAGSLSKAKVSEPLKVPVKPPRNLPLVRQNSVCDDRKYQDAFTSSLCETEFGYPGEKIQMAKSTEYAPKRKPALQGRYRLHSDVGRSEEDSDNDSAVSSSRSSISHGFSPPASPLLGSQYQDVEDSGQRMGCPLSQERIVLTKSVSSPSTLTFKDVDGSNKRVLKPQSVEAINRKNVLTSAKFSRGFDVKSGSPLIQRRFSQETADNSGKNLNFPNTLNQVLSSGNKYLKESSAYSVKTEKVAYITDVVDEPVVSEQLSKKKVEKSDSVPRAVVDTRMTTRKASIPLEYTWRSDDSWNKSFDPVPVNLRETSISKTSFDKSGDRSTVADKDFSFSDLKIKKEKSSTDFSTNAKMDSSSNDLIGIDKILTKGQPEPKGVRSFTDKMSNLSSRSVSVNDIRRTFEKADAVASSPGRSAKPGNLISSICLQNGVNGNHTRMSSLDSTTSDDGPYGYSSNLLREQFGSITSLASSTSLISPQELQLLIEEANQTLEESGNANGGSNSNNHDVLVIILHRDTVGGSIGITLAGGADYESKEITVHKVLAGSPADRDGRIQKGDRILSINGKSMKGVTHRESLAILKSPRLEVVLVVSRLKTDGNLDVVGSEDSTASIHVRTSSSRPPRILERSTLTETDESLVSDIARGPPVTLHLVKDGAGLGFSLEGGKDCSTGDRPLAIKKIFTGGVAEKCGQLKAGDELLNINGVDVSAMSRIDAWKLMKKLPDGNVTITVKHQQYSDSNSPK